MAVSFSGMGDIKGCEAKWYYKPKLSMGNGLKCSEITPKNYIIITKAK